MSLESTRLQEAHKRSKAIGLEGAQQLDPEGQGHTLACLGKRLFGDLGGVLAVRPVFAGFFLSLLGVVGLAAALVNAWRDSLPRWRRQVLQGHE